METKLKAFAELVQNQQKENRIKNWEEYDPNNEDHVYIVKQDTKTTIKKGRKYHKVDVGRSGKFMVTADTGDIYGVKGYGVIHKGHHYGTLDTIGQYWWGEYYPIKTGKEV